MSGYIPPQGAQVPNGPSAKLVAITKSDVTVLDPMPRYIQCGEAGTITLLAAGDTVAVQFTVAAGDVLPVLTKQVLATGTSITKIVGLL